MPASLADLRKARRTLICDVFDGAAQIQVSYRPGFLTPKVQAEIDRAAESGEGTAAAIRFFVGYIESWDLLGDDGEPVPLTEDGLLASDVPVQLLNQITAQCVADMQPGKRK